MPSPATNNSPQAAALPSWSAIIYLAVRALWRNKARALLTALGVVIGVGSVIAMIAIGAGAEQRIAAQLESMGSHNLVIRPGSLARGGVHGGTGTTNSLTLADAEELRKLPDAVAIAPIVRATEQVRYRGTNWNTSIEGVTPAFLTARSWPLAEGEAFTDSDVTSASHVCVLGQTTARQLFGLAKPVGETIVVKGLACRIIGVLAEKGASAWGNDQDDTILMPLTTVQRKIMGITHINSIEVQTSGREATFRMEKAAAATLRARHRLREEQQDDFRIFNRAELAQTAEASGRVFTWLLGSIASVSLLVGGIGIMNIMLVSVTERTREIGIRMALGARQRDILWQFLIEAMLLSGAGGILGIVLGIGGATLMSRFSEFSVAITSWSVILAFSFALIVGIFFGLHPAYKASRLKPIAALRYE